MTPFKRGSWWAGGMWMAGVGVMGLALAQEPQEPDVQQLDLSGRTVAEWQTEIRSLVRQLDADTQAQRDTAESRLLELARGRSKQFLLQFPEPNAQMPVAVRQRITAIRRTVERRLSQQATAGTTITLNAVHQPLTQVLEQLEQLSGNRLLDHRQQFEGQATNPFITLQVKQVPFWSAVDQLLDQASLQLYDFAGENALALVTREAGQANRVGQACYSGPFRFEVTQVTAMQGLRDPTHRRLGLELEIAWEPRLQPIALTQPLQAIEAVDDQGQTLPATQPGRVFQIEVHEGSCVTRITLPLQLPPRSAHQVAGLTGQLQALVPGRREEFRFTNLQAAGPQTQVQGGVHVTLERVVRNGPVWEVHMRFRLDDHHDALASHRGWVFNNVTYLERANGERVEHAGFETTRQMPEEVGVAYFFTLSDEAEGNDGEQGDEEPTLDGLTWVYRSPTAMISRSYPYKLEQIPLP